MLESLRIVKDPSNKEKSSRQFFFFTLLQAMLIACEDGATEKDKFNIREALGFLLFLSPHMYLNRSVHVRMC